MSNRVEIFLEKFDVIKVCENLKCDKECIPIKLGIDTTLFGNAINLEDLFEKLDKKLHKETYSDLEDKVFVLEDDLEVANEALTTLREIARGE